MCAVYKEEALSEKALLKHLDGKADGKKVAVSEEAVVSEEATPDVRTMHAYLLHVCDLSTLPGLGGVTDVL